MKVGPHAGRKVSEAKPIIKEAMLADGHALAYSEPEKMVSRCIGCCRVPWVLGLGAMRTWSSTPDDR
jgi:leucyl-tRNA synthetase